MKFYLRCPYLCWFFLLTSLICNLGFAGTVGFSVDFTNQVISIKNTGTESAYRLTAWSLGGAHEEWVKVNLNASESAYLEPGHRAEGNLVGNVSNSVISKACPVVIAFFDQAGAPFYQLTWRSSPGRIFVPLEFNRQNSVLTVKRDNELRKDLLFTYVISNPYQGIHELTQPISQNIRIPSISKHDWSTGLPITLDTGPVQTGVWLIHEYENKTLELQIIPDGVARGTEQLPVFIVFLRKYFLHISAMFLSFGLALVLFSFIKNFFKRTIDSKLNV